MFKLFSKLGLVLTVSLILNVICAFIAFKIVVSVVSLMTAVIGVCFVLAVVVALYSKKTVKDYYEDI